MLHLARQPIFNQSKDIIAYELLYRDSAANSANVIDGDLATKSVLLGTTLVESFDKLVGDKLAFVNFTKNLLQSGTAKMFPKENLVIEILEDIVPDEEFIDSILELKELGYTIALDDFTLDYPYHEVITLSDIIKVDFMLTSPEEQAEIIRKYRGLGVKFLAEKVETAEEFTRAKDLGYDLFQGYYFAKPSVFQIQDIGSLSSSYIDLLEALSSPNPNYVKLSSIVEKDVSLTFKLFKCANSPIYGGIQKINTVRGALVRIGFTNLKQWISLFLVKKLTLGQSEDLVEISLQRAKMMELLANNCGIKGRESEAFIIGLFSMLDVLVNRPMESILSELPLTDESKEAILLGTNKLGAPLSLIMAYEKGDWQTTEDYCRNFGIRLSTVSEAYLEAMDWAHNTLQYA